MGFVSGFQNHTQAKIHQTLKVYIPSYISQYNLISDKGYAFFLSIARIKLAIIIPDEYNDLVLTVASIGRPSLGNDKICLFTFLSMGKNNFYWGN